MTFALFHDIGMSLMTLTPILYKLHLFHDIDTCFVTLTFIHDIDAFSMTLTLAL